jgi:AhpD family alkylhydroperoxidase
MSKTNSSRLYSLAEAYKIMYRAFKGASVYGKALKKGLMNKEFSEKIMLAVTEVNGCAICSYAHTKMALESGMSGDEIKELLGGSMSNIPSEDLQAVMFAQHAAEKRGYPDKTTKQALIKDYGIEKSKAIMSAINFIMLGNAYGIPYGSLIARFNKKSKGAVDTRSNPFYEIAMLLSFVVFIPLALIHSFLARLFRRPVLKV